MAIVIAPAPFSFGIVIVVPTSNGRFAFESIVNTLAVVSAAG